MTSTLSQFNVEIVTCPELSEVWVIVSEGHPSWSEVLQRLPKSLLELPLVGYTPIQSKNFEDGWVLASA